MKKAVVYTQRVELIESYQERRDCADQKIPLFLEACGYIPIPIPNAVSDLDTFLEIVKPAGILLTGGNSLVKYGGDAPERDLIEHRLVKTAMLKEIPIYGFCRGMQVVLDYFGCELENVQGHVSVKHYVNGEWGSMEVNSYHNQACTKIKAPLQVMAKAEDGAIEAAVYLEKKIIVTMWHPEREVPFQKSDIARIRNLFERAETEKK